MDHMISDHKRNRVCLKAGLNAYQSHFSVRQAKVRHNRKLIVHINKHYT